MGSQATIDIDFLEVQDPRNIIGVLCSCGWEASFEGDVMYLSPDDIDYSWRFCKVSEFRVDEFLASHEATSRIGLVMTCPEGSGGEFLIGPTCLSFSASINRVYAGGVIPDFSWYLSRMASVIKNFRVASIRCEYIV